MNKEQKSVAYHEAAHAVAYFEMGRRIRKVTIVPSGDYQGCCFGYSSKIPRLDTTEITPRLRERVEWEIILYFVGSLAEKRFLGKHPTGWTKISDTHVAIDLALYLTGSEKELNAYLNWLYVRAEGFVYTCDWRWNAIQAIAQALLEKKTLTGEEAYAIWRSVKYEKLLKPGTSKETT